MASQPLLKAVLFDMDDTLIDWSKRTMDWADYRQHHLEQVHAYVNREVYPLDASSEFCQVAVELMELAWIDARDSLQAPNVGNIIVRALESMGVPRDRLDRDLVLRAYDWGAVAGVVAFPDVLEALPILRAAGIIIGIITNSSQPMWMRDIELRTFGLLHMFDGPRLSAADVGYLKPHPAIFNAALQELGVSASETVFVGDNPFADITGAQGVGMLAVLRDIGMPLLDENIHPDGVIRTFFDLLDLLDEWYPGWRVSPVQPQRQGAA